MALRAKETDQSPVRLSVELSPELYQALLRILETSNTTISVNELLVSLEAHLESAVANTVSEATGVAAPFPQGVEVEITSDDDEDDPVEGFRQAWKEAMEGKTRPIADLWEALDADTTD